MTAQELLTGLRLGTINFDDEAIKLIEAYKDKACKKAFDDGYKMGIEFGKSVGKTAERTNLKSEENKHE